ncbi:MAG: hypothetical protein QXG00_02345 [Candidatus Woesearchaeota archaeon]
MAEENKIEVFPEKRIIIRYSGLFDFDGLYKLIRNWFDEKRYEVQEKRYKDKPWSPMGSELEIDLEADIKETEYIRKYLIMKIQIFEKHEKEVIENTKKKKMTEARIQFFLEGKVVLDYTGSFKSKSSKLFQKFLHKYILKNEIGLKYVNPFYYEIFELGEKIKEFLGMETKEGGY